jgi:RND family efflux transporter MFP subunit
MRNIIAIVPQVMGRVIEVPVTTNQPLSEGDVLFRIDPEPFEAAVKSVRAQLALATTRLEQSRRLADADAGSRFEVEAYEAQVEQLDAGLEAAQFNLKSTTVRAPADGYVTNVALRSGVQAAAIPAFPSMTFVDTALTRVVAQIPEAYARHLEIGQPVEIALKYYPGQILTGKIRLVVLDSAVGQLAVSGNLPVPRAIRGGVFFAVIDLDDEALLNELPTGATGEVAVYTSVGTMTHMIRKVMIRMTTWTNYINPL